MSLEVFITERFLDFYNKEKGINFQIKEKIDNRIRNRPSYDFHCIDPMSSKEMGIEIKRLIPGDRRKKENIRNLFKRYVGIPLEGKLNGTFCLIISLYEFSISDSQNRKQRESLFNKIKEEILSNQDKPNHGKLACCKGIGLYRWSNEGNKIVIVPFTLSSAGEAEISDMLKGSLKKFQSDNNQNRINIVLLLELSDMCSRDEISGVIEELESGFEPLGKEDFKEGEKRDFSLINEIYHIALSRAPIIAQVHPHEKIRELGFFQPDNFMDLNGFLKLCNDYFRNKKKILHICF